MNRMSKIPTVTRSKASGNSLFSLQFMTFNTCSMCIRREYAQMLDEFFDMYGYEVERVKVPNTRSRKSWNYVKMRNSCHHGNVPASDMATINAIYDAGVTFWHTSDVGNYSLSNTIV